MAVIQRPLAAFSSLKEIVQRARGHHGLFYALLGPACGKLLSIVVRQVLRSVLVRQGAVELDQAGPDTRLVFMHEKQYTLRDTQWPGLGASAGGDASYSNGEKSIIIFRLFEIPR